MKNKNSVRPGVVARARRAWKVFIKTTLYVESSATTNQGQCRCIKLSQSRSIETEYKCYLVWIWNWNQSRAWLLVDHLLKLNYSLWCNHVYNFVIVYSRSSCRSRVNLRSAYSWALQYKCILQSCSSLGIPLSNGFVYNILKLQPQIVVFIRTGGACFFLFLFLLNISLFLSKSWFKPDHYSMKDITDPHLIPFTVQKDAPLAKILQYENFVHTR